MTAPRLLSDLLAEAGRQLADRRPSSSQDAAVLARLSALQARPALLQTAGGGGLQRVARGGAWAFGALLLLATALLLIEPPRGTATPVLPRDSGFMPVVSAEEWRQAMAGDSQAAVWLMPAELPRERLALLGLPFDAGRAEQTVHAELMLHPSGRLLAVRVLQ
jgi:hypothetical protein